MSSFKQLSNCFDTVMMQSDSGIRVGQYVKEFFDQFTVCSQRYSLELGTAVASVKAKMESMVRPDRMNSCFNSWFAFLNQMTQMARAQKQLVEDTNSKVHRPLVDYVEKATRTSKGIQDKIEEVMKAMRNLDSVVKVGEQRSQKLIDNFKKVKSKDSKKYRRKKDETFLAIESYKAMIRSANEKMNDYRYNQIPMLLMQMEKQERQRLKELQAIMTSFVAFQNNYKKSFNQVTSEMSGILQSVNPKDDITRFVNYCKQNKRTQSHSSFVKHFPFRLDVPSEIWASSKLDHRAMKVDLKKTSGTFSPESMDLLPGLLDSPPCTLFGYTLKDVMTYQAVTAPSIDLNYPIILRTLNHLVRHNDGLKTEGIFRVSPKSEKVQKLKQQFESGNWNVWTDSPHTPAALMKTWLRSLSEPIIPYDMYEECLQIGKMEIKDEPSELIASLLEKLPPINRIIIDIICQLILDTNQHEKVNKMGLQALAVVFAPSLFRGANPDNDTKFGTLKKTTMLKNTMVAERLTINLVKHYELVPHETHDARYSVSISQSVSSVSSKTQPARSTIMKSDEKSVTTTEKKEKPKPTKKTQSTEKVKSSETDPKEKKREIARQRIREEIISTEKTYVSGLDCLNNHFVLSLKQMSQSSKAYGLTDENMGAMTSNIEMLAGFHNTFLAEAEIVEAIELPSVFNKYGDMFKMYIPYVSSYEKSISTINALTESNKRFAQLMARIRKKLTEEGGLNLMSYMIMPVQRIPRYVLLLRELKKNYREDHPEYPPLIEALTKIEEIAKVINDSKKRNDQLLRVLEIANKLKGYDVNKNLELVSPHRSLVLEIEVNVVTSVAKKGTIKTTKQKIYLFTDVIVSATPNDKFQTLVRLAAARLEKDEEKKIIEIIDSKGIIRFFDQNDTSRNQLHDKIFAQLKYVKEERMKKRKMRMMKRRRGGNSQTAGNTAQSTIMSSLHDLNKRTGGETIRKKFEESKEQSEKEKPKKENVVSQENNVSQEKIDTEEKVKEKLKQPESPRVQKSPKSPRSPKSSKSKKKKRDKKKGKRSPQPEKPKPIPIEEDEDYDIL